MCVCVCVPGQRQLGAGLDDTLGSSWQTGWGADASADPGTRISRPEQSRAAARATARLCIQQEDSGTESGVHNADQEAQLPDLLDQIEEQNPG